MIQYEAAADSTTIPTTWGHKYDPANPDADFAGLVDVDASRQRQHFSGHKAQISHITVGAAGGLTGTEQKKEYTDIKKIPVARAPEDNFNILGGIGADDSERFTTTYMRQAKFEGLAPDQLTIEKRLGNKKQLPDPAQSQASIINPMDARSSGHGLQASNHEPFAQPQNIHLRSGLGGSSAGAAMGRSTLGKSLISGISKSIASKIEPNRSSTSREILSERTPNRTLVLDNYKTGVPGYTGSRRK